MTAMAQVVPTRTRMPTHIDDVDERWIENVLADAGILHDASVKRIERRVIGDQKGFLSVTARVAIDYDGPADGAPGSLVVKIEPPAGVFLDTARRFDAFAREIHFYRDMAPTLSLRLPRVWFADSRRDGSALVMEDLTGSKRSTSCTA